MYLFPLLLTVFIDSLGFGLVFPIFSPLIAGNETGMFSADVSHLARGWVFGILISCFFMGQFFGAPLLGSLSDRKGRKKILLVTLVAGFIGYICAGAAILLNNVPLLLLGRLLAGLSAGNFAIVQSMVADTSSEVDKAKNFGLIGMTWGLGFIIGPYVGGKFSNPGFASWCGWTTPFVFAAALCLLNILLLMWKCPETLPNPNAAKQSLWSGLVELKRAFEMPVLRNLFVVMTIFAVGWGFFTEFSPLFLISRFAFDTGMIGDFYAWVGIWITICQGFLIRPFLKKFTPGTLLLASLLLGGLVLPLMLLIETKFVLFSFLPLVVFFEAFICPTSTALVSNLAPKGRQGEILGINNSLQCVAYGIAPLFSGSFVALYPSLSVIVGCVCLLIAGTVLFVVRKRLVSIPEAIEGKIN